MQGDYSIVYSDNTLENLIQRIQDAHSVSKNETFGSLIGELLKAYNAGNDAVIDDLIKAIEDEYYAHHYLRVQIKTGKQRSIAQNSALQVYCRELAKAMNDAGHEREVNTPIGKCQLPWNADSVKENIWRPVQKAMTGEHSTTQPERSQYVEIYDVINRHLIETKGIHVPWPARENEPSKNQNQ